MLLRITILVFALAAGGAAAWLSMGMGGRDEPLAVVDPATQQIPTVEVLVAGVGISVGEVLAPDKLRWQSWPATSLNGQYVTQDARPNAVAELSGSFVNGPFAEGEPIRTERLMATNVNLMSNKISPGKRAVAVKITAENTAGGFILPGDRVDVILTTTRTEIDGEPSRNESKIIIANARVLAIDQTAVQTPEGAAVGKTATLELSPTEAERIASAEVSGLISLVLRPLTDHGTVEEIVGDDKLRIVRVHRATTTSTVTLR